MRRPVRSGMSKSPIGFMSLKDMSAADHRCRMNDVSV
jgi:hypothetical protein